MNFPFKIKYQIFKFVSALYGLNLSKQKKGIRILMYHSVGTPVEEDLYNIYNIHPELFSLHVEMMKKHETNVISLTEKNISLAESGIIVTFDDGFANNFETALPILNSYNIPFSVFITTNYVKEKKKYFLSKEQIKELSNYENIKIGSHAMNHVHLETLDKSALYNELSGSKNFLEDLIGKEIDAISYPNGSVNVRVRDICEEIGYKIGLTSWPNINNFNQDPLLLSRNAIWSIDSTKILKQKIDGKWDWMRYRYINPRFKD